MDFSPWRLASPRNAAGFSRLCRRSRGLQPAAGDRSRSSTAGRRVHLFAALAAAAFALGACGAPGPDFVTAHGVEVYLQGHGGFLDRAQADAMEEWFLGAVGQAGYGRGISERCLGLAEVRVVDSGYRCWADRPCAGEQLDRVLVVVDTGCAYSSAYVHEVAHWLQQCVKGGYDPDHRETALWELVGALPLRCPSQASAGAP